MCCGIGASFEVLQPLVDALNPGIEVILFDVPGVGGSPVRTVPLGFPRLAFLVSRILDELGHRQVDVLGFSGAKHWCPCDDAAVGPKRPLLLSDL